MMVASALEAAHLGAGGVIAAAGVAIICAGVVGLLRFPDFYTRAHAALSPLLIGALVALSGLAVIAWDGAIALRLGLLALMIAALWPVCVQMLADAAHAGGLAPLTGLYTAPRPGAERKP